MSSLLAVRPVASAMRIIISAFSTWTVCSNSSSKLFSQAPHTSPASKPSTKRLSSLSKDQDRLEPSAVVVLLAHWPMLLSLFHLASSQWRARPGGVCHSHFMRTTSLDG
jgi:hypothetical protein